MAAAPVFWGLQLCAPGFGNIVSGSVWLDEPVVESSGLLLDDIVHIKSSAWFPPGMMLELQPDIHLSGCNSSSIRKFHLTREL